MIPSPIPSATPSPSPPDSPPPATSHSPELLPILPFPQTPHIRCSLSIDSSIDGLSTTVAGSEEALSESSTVADTDWDHDNNQNFFDNHIPHTDIVEPWDGIHQEERSHCNEIERYIDEQHR
jgi:hypothetical protein